MFLSQNVNVHRTEADEFDPPKLRGSRLSVQSLSIYLIRQTVTGLSPLR
jgi:hypothetical protein